MRVRDSHAELVVRPGVLKSDELKAGIGIVVDQILVRRRIRGARKDANSSIDVVANPQKLLFEDRVDAVIPGDSGWHSDAREVGEREATRVEALVLEAAEMSPSAQFELASQTRIALL